MNGKRTDRERRGDEDMGREPGAPPRPGEKPKIIIDEDWKTRVERERSQQLEAGPPDPASSPQAESHKRVAGGDEASPAEPGPDVPEPQLPPASLGVLISTLATQTLASLGAIPIEGQEPASPRFELARFHIDTLGVLEEKTAGNRTAEESRMLSETLHELRMLFVAVQSRSAGES